MIAVDAAREAVESGDWARGLELVSGAAFDADPAALEIRAQAAYGAGELEAAVAAWESVHGLRLAVGQPQEAAWAAGMVAMYLLIDTGMMAPVRGWAARAERLLSGSTDAPALALVAMIRAYERFMCGDASSSRAHAGDAVRLGRELDVLPAVVIGQVAIARLRIADGEVDEGLTQLDEVAALLMSGDVDPLTTGMMYCELICAAQGLALHDRAREWTDVMDRWSRGAAFGGIKGRCRVHRAELLRVSGPCDDAEREALGACDELRPWMRREFGWPLVELGTIRLRRGDLAGAEDAFAEAHMHGWSPHPGLALLRLAQGDADAAAALVADAIEHPLDIPSKELPPFADLRLAPLLGAQVEIALRTGDAATADRASGALTEIADKYPSPGLAAAATLARGRAMLARGENRTAIDCLATAVSVWADLGAPYETACARLELGRAYRESGNDRRARTEWSTAETMFTAFGATGRATEAQHLLDPVGQTGDDPTQEVPTVTATFRREGGRRVLEFRGLQVALPDLKGFRYLERLLAEPRREFHVLDLVGVDQGVLRTAAVDDAGLPVLDDQARAAYRRRLADIEEDIEEAARSNDLGRRELAERDRDYLVAELSSAVGLGGRGRTVGGTAERARTSVARSLRYALHRLAEEHEAMAGHLRQAVRTGMYCSYAPDPIAPVVWRTLSPDPGKSPRSTSGTSRSASR